MAESRVCLERKAKDVVADHTRRWWGARLAAGAMGTGLMLGVAFVASESPSAAAQVGPAVQLGDGSVPAGLLGTSPTVSGDGRFVVYTAEVPADPVGELPEAAPEMRSTVFLVDRTDGSTTELSPHVIDLRAGNTLHPVIAGDSCTVAVVTEVAFDVFRDDDTGARWDVYRTKLPHCGGSLGEWELVSTQPGGTGLARDDVDPTDAPAMSRSGTTIAYTHRATQLPIDAQLDTPDAEQPITAISVVDLTVPISDDGRTTPAAGLPVIAPDTPYLHRGLDQPALSADGQHLAFRSDAVSSAGAPVWGTGAVEGQPATAQVFSWNRSEDDPFAAVTLISATPDGAPVGDGAGEPAISHDGTVVVYTSIDQGIVDARFAPCHERCPEQVYLVERDGDRDGELDEVDDRSVSIVSAVRDGQRPVAGTSSSSAPALSDDGLVVAFVSRAENLDPLTVDGGGAPGTGDIFIADVGRGITDRLTDDEVSSQPRNGYHANPSLDETGRNLVFDTAAPVELLPVDVVAARHIVAHSSPPQLSLPDVDLGTTLIGVPSDEWYVAVVNDGPSAFIPSTVTVDDPRFTINPDGSTCMLETPVAPGADCVVKVTFTPTDQSTAVATLTVSEVGFGAAVVSAQLTGSGGEPALLVTPGGADVGAVDVGVAAPAHFYDVANVSEFATSVDAVLVGGEHASDFAITSNGCVDRPLNPGATCAVGVTFTPTDSGRRTALIEVITPRGQRATAVIAGDGAFAPRLGTFEREVQAGRNLVVVGSGYRPNSEVSVALDGGHQHTVTTDDKGIFVLPLAVPDHSLGGEQMLIASSPDGVAVSDPVEVVPVQQPMIGLPGFGLSP